MSHIAVANSQSAALAHAGPAPTNPAPAGDGEGFATLLGELGHPAEATSTGKRKDEGRPPDAPSSPSAVNPLASLEAALASLGALPASAPATGATAAADAPDAAAPLADALNAAAGAIQDGFDLTGKTPLKAQLQGDPSLGMTSFQMKTFLAPANATPTKAGGATLGSESTWSPLALTAALPSEAAEAGAASRPSESRTTSQLSGVSGPSAFAPQTPAPPIGGVGTGQAAFQVPSAVSVGPVALADALPVPTESASPALAASRLSPEASAQAATTAPSPGRPALTLPSHGASGHNAQAAPEAVAAPTQAAAFGANDAGTNGHSAAPRDDAAPAAPSTDATASVASATGAAPAATVTLADLPAFIANQATTLAAPAADPQAPSLPNPAGAATPQAASAVKELQIQLEPGDLGEITLKLRLAGGKLSVTIGVANAKTLTHIQDDAELIASRLATGDQTLENLVIQRAAAPSAPETAQGHVTASDSDPSTSDGGGDSDGAAPQGDPSRPARGGAGGYSV